MSIPEAPIDYRLAFDLAPVGLVLSRHRTVVDCNRALCEMFGTTKAQLVGKSFQVLYPSADEYERAGLRMAPILNAQGRYADDRLMKRVDGRLKGQLFWCHVIGHALHRHEPHAAGIWTFEDLSASRPVQAALSPREREVAALVTQGLSAKAMGKTLGLSHRTVEIYRAKLMRKYGARTTADLVHRLMGGSKF